MLEKIKKIPLYTVLTKQFPLALKAIATRSEIGHQKYKEIDGDYQGFTKVDSSEYPEALMRHIFNEGEEHETELDHAIATAWNAVAILELKLRDAEKKSQLIPYELYCR